jgi:hypothetical protein
MYLQATVAVTITRYTDSHQPGWVEGYLTDVDGKQWWFPEVKWVDVADSNRVYLDADTIYPVLGEAVCQVAEVNDGVATIMLVDVGLTTDTETQYPRLRVPVSMLVWDVASGKIE